MLKEKGWSLLQIARELDLDPSTVRRYFLGGTSPASKTHRDPNRLDKVIALRREGWSADQIAVMLAINPNVARYWIKKANAVFREEKYAGR